MKTILSMTLAFCLLTSLSANAQSVDEKATCRDLETHFVLTYRLAKNASELMGPATLMHAFNSQPEDEVIKEVRVTLQLMRNLGSKLKTIHPLLKDCARKGFIGPVPDLPN